MNQEFSVKSLIFELDQTTRLAKTYCNKHFDEEFQKQMSFDDFFVLCIVKENPEIHQSDLAKKLLKGRSHMSKCLKIMEKKGLIERPVVNKEHKSVRILKITDKGINLLTEAEKKAVKFTRQLEDVISTKEFKSIISSLNKLKTTILSVDNITFD